MLQKPAKVVKTEEMPPAVQEMMNVLGTLRRRTKHRQTYEGSSSGSNSGVGTDNNTTAKTLVSPAPADVAL